MNYLATILVVVIAIILYYFYYYITNNELTSGLQNLAYSKEIPYSKLKNPNTYTYSYQCWIYISSPTNGEKQIYHRKTGDTGDSPIFEVDINGQTLLLKAGTGGQANSPKSIMTITSEFPIQKWTYLVINVYNLQTFEAYINGKLAKTVNVPSGESPKPVSNRNNLYIGGSSLDGYITKFTRTEKTLDAKTVWENYLSGNGLSNLFSTLIPYGLNLSISKGEEVQRSVSLF
jgi:hypothetical protein